MTDFQDYLPAQPADFALDSDEHTTDIRSENLFSHATRQWQSACHAMASLLQQAPGIRALLKRRIHEQWALDSDAAGLQFNNGQRLSLTEACAYVLQVPVPAAGLDDRCSVYGTWDAAELNGLTPTQVLVQLKGLKLEAYLRYQWITYWESRAPGTAVSRQTHAEAQYRAHFEAAGERAFALGILDLRQFGMLKAVLDPREPDTALVTVQTPCLLCEGQAARRLSGAMLISTTLRKDTTHVLYLPSHAPALLVFADRTQMEEHLLQRQHVYWSDLGNEMKHKGSIACEQHQAPVRMAFLHLMEHLREAMYRSVLFNSSTEPGVPGYSPLAAADQFDNWRQNTSLIAEAPTTDGLQGDEHPADSAHWNGLYQDLPVSARLHAVQQQQEALEALLNDDKNNVQPLRHALRALAQARSSAEEAIRALLPVERLRELRAHNAARQTDLKNAWIAGQRAEADIQSGLNQLDGADLALIKAVLDEPVAARRLAPVIAAALALQLSTDTTQVHYQRLDGALLLCHANPQQEVDEQRPMVLFWPGHSLIRFPSLDALQRDFFKLAALGTDAQLLLTPLSGDAFDYSLQHLLASCEQAALEIHQTHASDDTQRTAALEQLSRDTFDTLHVPDNPARRLALARIEEQGHTTALASQLPSWLQRLEQGERSRLKALISDYLPAARRAQRFIEQQLPPRERFARRQVDSRLRQAFSLGSTVDVLLDLPDMVKFEKELIPGSGAPGTPSRLVQRPSAERSTMPLHELALINVDDAMVQRLGFVKISFSGGTLADRSALERALDAAGLRRFVAELDLAACCEQRIRDTFMGPVGETELEQGYRLECLHEPLRLMLQIQASAARHQHFITPLGEEILRIAMDATSSAAFNANGRCIRLLPAGLTAGGKDTDERGTTLSGVTFIHDSNSGITVLYLPDSPDGIFLRQYDDLEQARKGLYNLAFKQEMTAWLAGRALAGDPAFHESRISAACIAHHDRIIGIDAAWPTTTSLTAHLCNVHLGRLVQAHRATSRANSALRLEQAALASGMIFNYIKMALGVVPFVGTAIALYDAWITANQAAAAFLAGKPGDGLDQLELLLGCLIDAAMDLIPGAGISPSSARQLTRQRQLRSLGSTAQRTVAARFAGYEYPHDISLSRLTPDTTGIYRNVYRHFTGDFILSQGQAYSVRFDHSRHTWRLTGKGTSAYQQPIAMDEAGNWDTHGALYGVNIVSPTSGGGNMVGRVADLADPLWPEAIRQHLPDWWTNQALRRQRALRSSIDAKQRDLARYNLETNELQQRFNQSRDPVRRVSLWDQLQLRFTKERELGKDLYQDLEDMWHLSSGNKRRLIKDLQSRLAWLQVDRQCNELDHVKRMASKDLDQIDDLVSQTRSTPPTAVIRHVSLMQRRKIARIALVEKLDNLASGNLNLDTWRKRVTQQAHRAEARSRIEEAHHSFDAATTDMLKVSQYLEIINRYESATDFPWFDLQRQIVRSRVAVDRALINQFFLPGVQADLGQRRRVLQASIDTYHEYRRNLLTWNTSYPDYLDQRFVQPLLEKLRSITELAEQWKLRIPPEVTVPRPHKGPAQRPRRLFETEDDQLLTGIEEHLGDEGQQIAVGDVAGHKEIWVPGNDGRWRLKATAEANPAPATPDLGQLTREARSRLDKLAAYIDKVQSYTRQNMLPADLEHMLVSEAHELRARAGRIADQDPRAAIITTLRAKADELIVKGRTLRIDQTLNSKTPTEGMLDYLVDQRSVEIIRLGGLSELPKRPDGRRDFLQEFEVRDVTRGVAQPLWYAHFHYTSADPAFDGFAKAHLKAADQRRLGLQWQQAQGGSAERIWRGDIGKPLARKHFEALFA